MTDLMESVRGMIAAVRRNTAYNVNNGQCRQFMNCCISIADCTNCCDSGEVCEVRGGKEVLHLDPCYPIRTQHAVDVIGFVQSHGIGTPCPALLATKYSVIKHHYDPVEVMEQRNVCALSRAGCWVATLV